VSESSPEDLQELVVQNSLLAERLEAAEADRDGLIGAREELQWQLDGLRREVEEVRQALAAAEDRARAAGLERDRLGESLGMTEARLTDEPRAQVMPPTEVSALVGRLVSGLESQLSGMTVGDGEVQLKLAVEKVGDQPGFVVPTPESPPEVLQSLHTLTMQLVRKPE
jgi:hypothetical protein